MVMRVLFNLAYKQFEDVTNASKHKIYKKKLLVVTNVGTKNIKWLKRKNI